MGFGFWLSACVIGKSQIRIAKKMIILSGIEVYFESPLLRFV
ncbi:hypothetical protein COXBURSA331_A1719 [Coxiella burnetii RSA 331]|nr:hypothetical protein COXBURSA331_A1719 [Coxiella burnetii RSA 331]EDR35684.1 hypothetical protein COXBURSA334_0383 [Coxiella burnetii Q321]